MNTYYTAVYNGQKVFFDMPAGHWYSEDDPTVSVVFDSDTGNMRVEEVFLGDLSQITPEVLESKSSQRASTSTPAARQAKLDYRRFRG